MTNYMDDPASEEESGEHQPRTKSNSPSAEDVKDRLRAARRSGPDRPFYQLAAAEAALNARSTAYGQTFECIAA